MRGWMVAIREERELSQKGLADRIGIAQSTYSAVENGTRNPSVPMAKRIAEELGVEWTRFFEESEQQEKETA